VDDEDMDAYERFQAQSNMEMQKYLSHGIENEDEASE
jgi:hypothetical protein